MRAKSELRLFLSVDIAGSTALKSSKSYEALRERIALLKTALRTSDTRDIPSDILPSMEDFDWAAIQEGVFHDFHTEFEPPATDCELHERAPWKAIGDELVYSFRVKSRDQAGKLLCRFLRILRLHDRKLAKGGLVRLKGSAWVAGFPVRNRIVQLPDSEVAGRKRAARVDYWGPDIDIGFRLGRCSFPGMCVASLGLVELLVSQDSANQLRFAQVGWEKLKGVWEERPYPIFWAELPAGGPDAARVEGNDVTSAFVHPWAPAESKFLARWQAELARSAVKEAKDWKGTCDQIRDSLPQPLGGVAPYIPGSDPIPNEHIEVLALLDELSAGAAGTQVQKPSRRGTSNEPFDPRVSKLVTTSFVRKSKKKR